MSPNKDKTGNERQQRRREREKAWLKEHGFKSWEALHTALMNDETSLTKREPAGATSRKKSVLVNNFMVLRSRPCGLCKPFGGILQRRVMISKEKIIEILREETWVEVDSARVYGVEKAAEKILQAIEAAEQSAHPTLLPARHKLVSCPQCKLMFGVDLPASQSG